MPPIVACALVETSTGNQRPSGFSCALRWSRTRPGSTVAVRRSASTATTRRRCLVRVDDERRAGRLAALARAGAARQHRHGELARDLEGDGDVAVALRHEHADRHDLVDRGVGRVPAARGGVEAAPRLRSRRAGAGRARRRPRCGSRVLGAAGASARAIDRIAVILGRFCPRTRRLVQTPNDRAVGSARMPQSQGAMMLDLDFHPAGRHFLQIPGPSPVPDRILRAMSLPTIDHRGPGVRRARQEGARRRPQGLQDAPSGRHLSGLGHRRVGSGARQHAERRRRRADGRDRPLRRALAEDGGAPRPGHRGAGRARQRRAAAGSAALAPRRPARPDRGAPAPRRREEDQGGLRRPQRDLDRRALRHRRREEGDRRRRPSGAAARRLDLRAWPAPTCATTSGASTSPSAARRRA